MMWCIFGLPRFRGFLGRAVLAALCALLLVPALVGGNAHASAPRAVQKLTYANPTLVRDPNGAVYLVWNDVRHWINSPAAFSELGYSSSQETALAFSAIDAIPNGNVLALNTVSGGLVWPLAPITTSPVLLSVNRPAVSQGQIIHLNGSGFQANEQVVITAPDLTFNANADGQGNLSVDVPISTGTSAGLHHIYVLGASSGDFSVQVIHVVAPGLTDPTISLLSTSIPVDGGVSVTGGGFAAGETVRLFLDNGALTAQTTASSTGSYGPITIPLTSHFQVGSTYWVSVYGASSMRFNSTPFSVIAAAPTATATVIATATATATATPVTAALLNLSASSVAPGGQVVVGGTGFRPQETVLVYFNGALQGGPTSDGTGAFSGAVISVPGNYTPGAYSLMARGAASGITASAVLTVLAAPPTPTAAILPSAGQVVAGSPLGVSGTGFVAGEQVRITFNNVLVATAVTVGDGSFVNTLFTVPASTAPGRYGISGSGVSSGRVAGAAVTVLARPVAASISVSPTSAINGQTITISGAGWSARETVLVKIDGNIVLAPQSDANGRFSVRYVVRLSVALHTVSAQGAASSRLAQTTLGVVRPITAGISLSPSRVERGKSVSVSGVNFQAGEIVLVRFRGNLMAAPTARSDGRISGITFIVADNTPLGNQQVTITGVRSLRVAKANVYVLAKPQPVKAKLSVSPSSTKRGGRVYVSGSGFRGSEEVLVRYHNIVVLAIVANPSGAFSRIGFTVASNTAYGSASLAAKGVYSGRSASATLKVVAPAAPAYILVSPSRVQERHIVTISGGDFSASEYVLITLDNAKVALVKTNGSGAFKVNFVLPNSARPGTRKIVATGTHSGRKASFALLVTR